MEEKEWPAPKVNVHGIHFVSLEEALQEAWKEFGTPVGTGPFGVGKRRVWEDCAAGFCVVPEKLANDDRWWLIRFWWKGEQPPKEYQQQYAQAVRDLVELRYSTWKENNK